MAEHQPPHTSARKFGYFLLLGVGAFLILFSVLRWAKNQETPDRKVSVVVADPETIGPASHGEGGPQRRTPNEKEGKEEESGGLLVEFSIEFNARFCLVVFSDSKIESKTWCHITGWPGVKNPKKAASVSNLSGGNKLLRVIGESGLSVALKPFSISPPDTTTLHISVPKDEYDRARYRVKGRVVTASGEPAVGVALSTWISNANWAATTTKPRNLIANRHTGSSSTRRIHDETPRPEDPYSKEYLASLLKPAQEHRRSVYSGFKSFSDGAVYQYFMTNEAGTFNFVVASPSPVPVTVKYPGGSTSAIVTPGESNLITLPGDATPVPTYAKLYEKVMRAVFLKEPGSLAQAMQLLEESPLNSETELRQRDFDRTSLGELFRSPSNAHDVDLARRKDHLRRCRQLASRIAFLVGITATEPEESDFNPQ